MILLTGGAGFVGLNVAEQLLARGDEVLILDLRPPPGFFSKARYVQGDVTDQGLLKKVFQEHEIRRVIHMSAITAGPERDAREPRRIAEVNLIGTLNVLEAARNSGVGRFVHASTGALFGAAGIGVDEPLDEERHRPVPESMYGITKYAAERSCLRLAGLWGIDVRIGRLALAFGRWEHESGVRDRLSPPTEIARIARAGGEAVFPPLGETDYIYAPDVARALIALADAKAPSHRLYHLGTGTAWALPAWCELLQKRFPKFRWREASEACNVVPLAPGTRTRFSNRRLVDDLGWKPRYELTAAAEDFIAWLAKGSQPRRCRSRAGGRIPGRA
jgi:nucleoside-diphosphate-sugar epimerase